MSFSEKEKQKNRNEMIKRISKQKEKNEQALKNAKKNKS